MQIFNKTPDNNIEILRIECNKMTSRKLHPPTPSDIEVLETNLKKSDNYNYFVSSFKDKS